MEKKRHLVFQFPNKSSVSEFIRKKDVRRHENLIPVDTFNYRPRRPGSLTFEESLIEKSEETKENVFNDDITDIPSPVTNFTLGGSTTTVAEIHSRNNNSKVPHFNNKKTSNLQTDNVSIGNVDLSRKYSNNTLASSFEQETDIRVAADSELTTRQYINERKQLIRSNHVFSSEDESSLINRNERINNYRHCTDAPSHIRPISKHLQHNSGFVLFDERTYEERQEDKFRKTDADEIINRNLRTIRPKPSKIILPDEIVNFSQLRRREYDADVTTEDQRKSVSFDKKFTYEFVNDPEIPINSNTKRDKLTINLKRSFNKGLNKLNLSPRKEKRQTIPPSVYTDNQYPADSRRGKIDSDRLSVNSTDSTISEISTRLTNIKRNIEHRYNSSTTVPALTDYYFDNSEFRGNPVEYQGGETSSLNSFTSYDSSSGNRPKDVHDQSDFSIFRRPFRAIRKYVGRTGRSRSDLDLETLRLENEQMSRRYDDILPVRNYPAQERYDNEGKALLPSISRKNATDSNENIYNVTSRRLENLIPGTIFETPVGRSSSFDDRKFYRSRVKYDGTVTGIIAKYETIENNKFVSDTNLNPTLQTNYQDQNDLIDDGAKFLGANCRKPLDLSLDITSHYEINNDLNSRSNEDRPANIPPTKPVNISHTIVETILDEDSVFRSESSSNTSVSFSEDIISPISNESTDITTSFVPDDISYKAIELNNENYVRKYQSRNITSTVGSKYLEHLQQCENRNKYSNIRKVLSTPNINQEQLQSSSGIENISTNSLSDEKRGLRQRFTDKFSSYSSTEEIYARCKYKMQNISERKFDRMKRWSRDSADSIVEDFSGPPKPPRVFYSEKGLHKGSVELDSPVAYKVFRRYSAVDNDCDYITGTTSQDDETGMPETENYDQVLDLIEESVDSDDELTFQSFTNVDDFNVDGMKCQYDVSRENVDNFSTVFCDTNEGTLDGIEVKTNSDFDDQQQFYITSTVLTTLRSPVIRQPLSPVVTEMHSANTKQVVCDSKVSSGMLTYKPLPPVVTEMHSANTKQDVCDTKVSSGILTNKPLPPVVTEMHSANTKQVVCDTKVSSGILTNDQFSRLRSSSVDSYVYPKKKHFAFYPANSSETDEGPARVGSPLTADRFSKMTLKARQETALNIVNSDQKTINSFFDRLMEENSPSKTVTTSYSQFESIKSSEINRNTFDNIIHRPREKLSTKFLSTIDNNAVHSPMNKPWCLSPGKISASQASIVEAVVIQRKLLLNQQGTDKNETIPVVKQRKLVDLPQMSQLSRVIAQKHQDFEANSTNNRYITSTVQDTVDKTRSLVQASDNFDKCTILESVSKCPDTERSQLKYSINSTNISNYDGRRIKQDSMAAICSEKSIPISYLSKTGELAILNSEIDEKNTSECSSGYRISTKESVQVTTEAQSLPLTRDKSEPNFLKSVIDNTDRLNSIECRKLSYLSAIKSDSGPPPTTQPILSFNTKRSEIHMNYVKNLENPASSLRSKANHYTGEERIQSFTTINSDITTSASKKPFFVETDIKNCIITKNTQKYYGNPLTSRTSNHDICYLKVEETDPTFSRSGASSTQDLSPHGQESTGESDKTASTVVYRPSLHHSREKLNHQRSLEKVSSTSSDDGELNSLGSTRSRRSTRIKMCRRLSEPEILKETTRKENFSERDEHSKLESGYSGGSEDDQVRYSYILFAILNITHSDMEMILVRIFFCYDNSN